ncbi:hypothetical protein A3C98_05065 [Candidatus Roizmanbacteria bacterium RIFCSPHIGHO2_02_FULL_37_15]|uniref:Transcription regulator TrmB N-terminal domain-containing protein n=1 Tax=Candidatus Roizmanbacteria bacterium RIFCSPLOWO2_01_FULL_37_16 TaxID=1802058 RepID=A0A1F7ILJ6_9BACT|nr:MAG: hypothetical protein A2859_02105 [Candidatus Roizmanbacteria bacterium RIFCSPHIGHO2_01_FULL_37_16b]OGK22439.1 MAG: hypothetical protein A3C98_05065 [Candidatus Roizmanbacteria bacterium RIFCSPHIGHO2_02_FULL_37_15]OGK32697.1 MAG: hypothetical protein A3F57_02770 [Candidatus Roizmanbacteria bacterium RIFCSPHIGHO2_12_FULL_36_11]OGK44239.1 MAG: hypothetical protein A3B40_03670 [Candidatus Roizmanbacteria bacterium RIFCSPLOWO2_01_FULL_37_16]OGK56522.1 MAG: hypothetical protein A3I50_05000 [C
MDNETLSNFLKELGLTVEEAKIYEILVKRGAQTTLELSRSSEVNRTKVYRILEKLKKQGLIEEIIEENKHLTKAVGLNQLDLLIKKQESKAAFLRKIFPNITSYIYSSLESVQPGTRVVFHRGSEGIKQMVWNVLSSRKECVGYTFRRIEEVVGDKFSLEWRDEFVKRRLIFRDIYSDEYLKSLKAGKETTKPEWKKYFIGRYLANKVLYVNHQIDIYNNVFAIYNWHEGEVFGVEIYNEKVAVMQKQLFEIVWKMAKSPPKNLKS